MSFRSDQGKYVTLSEQMTMCQPRTVHVVIGLHGKYSDRTEYVAGVFEDAELAKQLILEKTAKGREAAKRRNEWEERRYQLENAAREAKRTPEMKEWDKTDYKWPVPGLDADEQEEIDRRMGEPRPKLVDYDHYYVVSVPLGEWGRWEEFETEDYLDDEP